MKPHTMLSRLVVAVLAASSAVSAITAEEFNAQLAQVDQAFASRGPSLEILSQYDALLRDTPEGLDEAGRMVLLAKVHYKKAIISLSLGKESQAMQDFEISLGLNPSNEGVKKNLLGLIVKYGQREKLENIKRHMPEDDPLLKDTLEKIHIIDGLSRSGDKEKLSEAIQLAPFDTSLREKRIALTQEAIKSTSDSNEQAALFANIADDLDIITKVNPTTNSENWNRLSDIYLFALGEYTNSLTANKKCLHYNMDFETCKKNSKFLNKYSTILTHLATHHRYFQHIQSEQQDNEAHQLEEMDFKDLSTRLTDKGHFLKIRRENEKFDTNLAYIISKSDSFNKQYSIKGNKFEDTIFETLAMDSLLRHDSKSFKKYATRSPKDSLARRLNVIDGLIHEKSFEQAQQEINGCPTNMKESTFLKSRIEKIQAHISQKQQQQRRQQYHQQQQHQRQQHQQQRSQSPPKNDYYKILGVPRNADDGAIKKAYREMTKQFHPDKYKGDMTQEEVEAKMTEINHAYEVLSDEQKRKDYDAGHDPNDPESQKPGGHGGAGFGGHPFHGAQFRQSGGSGGNPFGGFNFNFGGQQFGGMRSGGPRFGSTSKKGSFSFKKNKAH